MALAPRFAGHRAGNPEAANVLEAYLDFVCPYSAKIYGELIERVLPWVEATYPGKVQFIFRHQIQPWHPQSTFVHEASLAVERLSEDSFFPFATELFRRQKDYFDESIADRSRHEIYGMLSQHLDDISEGGATLRGKREEFLSLLRNSQTEPRNIGNRLTTDLKWHIRFARQQGIHVSPTVLWNGLVENKVSSSWSLDDWKEWFHSYLQS